MATAVFTEAAQREGARKLVAKDTSLWPDPTDKNDYEEETTTMRFACTLGEGSDLSGDESQEDEDEEDFSDEDSDDGEVFPVL